MKDRDILAAWGLGIVYGAFVAVAVLCTETGLKFIKCMMG